MNDARQAFHDLQALAGEGFEDTVVARAPERVQHRVAVRRRARAAVGSLACVAVVAAAALGLTVGNGPQPAPVTPPVLNTTLPTSPSPDPSPEAGVSWPAACHSASVISGKPVGTLGGLEGWFNATPTAPCDEWDPQILDHPDTVLIFTADNTMVEAYYRTDISALGVYASLAPDFVVPDPDPAWPQDQLVLIDARTGEVLQVSEVPETFGDAGVGATELSTRLLNDRDALAERLESIAREGGAPDGFQVDPSSTGQGSGGDLVEPLVFVPGDHPLSDDLPTIVARLVPGDATAANDPAAERLETAVPVDGAALFDVADPRDMESRTMRLGIPVGGDSTLIVVGSGAMADRYLIELVTWHMLAQ